MKTIARLIAAIVLGAMSSGCYAGLPAQDRLSKAEISEILALPDVLSKSEVETILRKADIKNVFTVEQQPQDEGTVDLVVTSGLRSTEFSGCLADQASIEVVPSEQGWNVKSMSKTLGVSISPCDKAVDSQFSYVGGVGYSDERLGQSIHYLRQFIAGSLSPALTTFKTLELKEFIDHVDMDDMRGLFLSANGDVEFQMFCEAIVPRLLGIRISVRDGNLTGIYVNDDNGVEIVEP